MYRQRSIICLHKTQNKPLQRSVFWVVAVHVSDVASKSFLIPRNLSLTKLLDKETREERKKTRRTRRNEARQEEKRRNKDHDGKDVSFSFFFAKKLRLKKVTSAA